MRRLIIDTATRTCSVALFDGDSCIAAFREDIGRGHAERLVPMIAELPDCGRAGAIHVNVGPGSFTGIRVGVSAARALALAWDAECYGYGCLDLVAAMARSGEEIVVDVAMTGGHGEVYFQTFSASGAATAPPVSLSPEIAVTLSSADCIAGDVAEKLVTLRGSGGARTITPDARHWQGIANSPTLPASPVYIRAPDAKLPGGKTP